MVEHDDGEDELASIGLKHFDNEKTLVWVAKDIDSVTGSKPVVSIMTTGKF